MLQYMLSKRVNMGSDGFLDDVRLKKAILWHLDNGKYRLTKHAAEEQAKDAIDLGDTVHVLKTGSHDKSKTLFNNAFQAWHYAIKGKTEDLKNVFSQQMMIVTVMKV